RAPLAAAPLRGGRGRERERRPRAPDELLRPGGREEQRWVDVAEAEGVVDPGRERRLVDDGHDRSRDQVPAGVEFDRDDGLHVHDPDGAVLRAGVEVELCWNGTLMRSATGF